MALTGSGELKFSQMRDEFGGSGQVKFSDLYRGGSLVRAKAGNNPSTNLAANVPTSGEIQVADFYSQAKGFRHTYSSGATNQDASALFGDDYGVDYPKEIVINSGVELGATSTGQEALQIDSGLSGSMTITNNGTLTGAGGAAGGAGGDAFQADAACTLINNGTIRAGGGGGGAGGTGGTGGTGGQGSQAYSYYGSWTSYTYAPSSPFTYAYYRSDGASLYWYWQSSHVGTTSIPTTSTGSNPQYQRQTSASAVQPVGPQYPGGGGYQVVLFAIRRRSLVSGTNYYNGGSGGSGGGGGSGGVGQGYQQSATSGSSGSSGSGGSSGGTNAGSGGTGGTGGAGGAGGSYGQGGSSGSAGNTGATGGNGNHTNGSGGSSGGGGSSGANAGNYIRGLSNVTLTQNGTVQGGTVN